LLYHTATDDNKFKLVSEKMLLADVAVSCQSNDAYFGDHNNQLFEMNVGDVYTFDSIVDVDDLFFKNKTAGSNTKIVITGVKV